MRPDLATIETVLPGDLDVAWQSGETFADQDFSIVDRASFAMTERLGLAAAASSTTTSRSAAAGHAATGRSKSGADGFGR